MDLNENVIDGFKNELDKDNLIITVCLKIFKKLSAKYVIIVYFINFKDIFKEFLLVFSLKNGPIKALWIASILNFFSSC